MARFDVYRLRNGSGALVVDCQADILSFLETRFVVPLILPDEGPIRAARLNPTLRVDGHDYAFYAQYAASLPRSELGELVTSLLNDDTKIIGALDVLMTGV